MLERSGVRRFASVKNTRRLCVAVADAGPTEDTSLQGVLAAPL